VAQEEDEAAEAQATKDACQVQVGVHPAVGRVSLVDSAHDE